MRLAECLFWALLIVMLDAAAFVLPLAALLLAYVLLARPPWFRDWVERLYGEAPPKPAAPDDRDPPGAMSSKAGGIDRVTSYKPARDR
jgi:hypothetical protein